MAKEYKLSYTAQEINEKLGKIGEPVSWNELTDKPFGIEIELIEIVPEQSVTGSINTGIYVAQTTDKIAVDRNKKYIVTINGKKYTATITNINTMTVIGNLAVSRSPGAEDTGEPFMISIMPTGNNLLYWEPELGETITLAIYEEQEVVKLIDDNLIPDTIARKADIEDALANIDSSVSAPNAAPNQQLVTDEFGNTKWEDKVLYKSNRTVINFNTDECSDHGEDATDGRFEFEVPFTQLGHDIPNIWSNAEWPLTFQLDDESFTIAGRRLPIILSNPTDKIKRAQIYQYGADILISMTFDEPGDHTFVFEAGRDKYTQLDYGYMPEGYPKIVSTRANSTNAASVTGTTVDGGESYYATFSSFTPVAGTTYQIFIGSVGYDFDVFVATATTDENGNVIVGDLMAPHVEPPFCMIHQTGDTYPTLYWNGKYGAQIYFGKSEIQEEIVPMDEKFLPDTIMRKGDISWEDLTDKPFYSGMDFVTMIDNVSLEIDEAYDLELIDVQLEPNELYIVTVNGEDYECISAPFPDDPNYIELGNAGLTGGEDNGMPFVITHIVGNSTSSIMMSTSGTHIVSVKHKTEVTKPIDEKFIPDSVALKSDIEDAIAGLEVGGGSVEPVSWNDLTDKPELVTSWNDLEDKPFGVKTEEVVVLEATTGAEMATSTDGTVQVYKLHGTFDDIFEVGVEYTVTINDGEPFNITFKYNQAFRVDANRGRDEDIVIGAARGSGAAFGSYFAGLLGTYVLIPGTYKFTKLAEIMYPIPKSYLPEDVVYENQLEGRLANDVDWNNVKNKPFGDVETTTLFLNEKVYNHEDVVDAPRDGYFYRPGTFKFTYDYKDVYYMEKDGNGSFIYKEALFDTYPFIVYAGFLASGASAFFVRFKDGQPHAFRGEFVESTEFKYLDEQFIPDTIVRQEYVDTTLEGKADSVHSHNEVYYTKSEIENMEFISVDDIDAICGADIQAMSEVSY